MDDAILFRCTIEEVLIVDIMQDEGGVCAEMNDINIELLTTLGRIIEEEIKWSAFFRRYKKSLAGLQLN